MNLNGRPPIASDAAPSPGAAARPAPTQHPITWDHTIARTARIRPLITPQPWPQTIPNPYPATHPYVRTYWRAALGPGAIADLLRLATAAQRNRSLALPTTLATLAKADLIRLTATTLQVKITIPPLPARYHYTLTPHLRHQLTQT